MINQRGNFDESKSSHVLHIPDEYKMSNLKPVIHSSEDVKRMAEESARARVISQIMASPEDYQARDFTASFQSATRDTDPPEFVTSHKTSPEDRRPSAIPTYSSQGHIIRWNPYVEVTSAENSQTDLVEVARDFNCKCRSCSVKNCPSRISSPSTMRPSPFKDNIMTFSDQCTMTPVLNDAYCGVCTPIPTAPKLSDVCASSDVAVRDTETITNFPKMYNQACAPIPILKISDYTQPPCVYGYCGLANGHVPAGIRQEAVRDTDIGEDYCEPIKPKSIKNYFKFMKKHAEQPHCKPKCNRRIIYNEGISNSVTQRWPIPPIRVPSPVNISKGCSRGSVDSRIKSYIDTGDGIPYTHRSESKYHHSCKKPEFRPSYYTDADEIRHVVESPKVVRKTVPSRPTRGLRASSIALPRKVLTSESNIESYIEKARPEIYEEPPSCRRTMNKK